MAKPMKAKAMKAMRAMKTTSAMRDCAGKFIGAYSKVAEMVDLKPKQVEAIAEAMIALAAKQLNETGSFKLADAFTMKLTKKPARKAMDGVHPITKEPCVFKARSASQTLRAKPLKKFMLDYLNHMR